MVLETLSLLRQAARLGQVCTWLLRGCECQWPGNGRMAVPLHLHWQGHMYQPAAPECAIAAPSLVCLFTRS
jgi:hypothetical protein